MSNALGPKLRTIILRGSDFGPIIVVLLLVAILVALAAMFAPIIAIWILALGLIPIAATASGYVLRRNRPNKVEIFESGIEINAPGWAKTIRWQDITGVQVKQASQVYLTPNFLSLANLLDHVGRNTLLSGGIPPRQSPRRFYQCRYLFRLKNETTFELNGDARLLDLMSDIDAKVFSRIIPDEVKRFQTGESLPLTNGVSYSKVGLKGSLVRETRHSRHEVSVDLPWSDVEQIYRSDSSFHIKPKIGQPIIIQMGEIINAPVFLKILALLSERNAVPRVT